MVLGWVNRLTFHKFRLHRGLVSKLDCTHLSTNAMLIIAPVALILVAENLGHIKAVGAMTGEDLTPYLGKAFVADGNDIVR
jgi:xanthine/uracil permease